MKLEKQETLEERLLLILEHKNVFLKDQGAPTINVNHFCHYERERPCLSISLGGHYPACINGSWQ